MAVYAGKLLRVNLTDRTWKEEEIAEDDVRKWLLGSGLAAKLYYDEMDPTLDPLDPASPLIVMNGVLTGTFAPTGCRTSFCGRSPLTGIWNEANLGGHFGAELRFAGYDGLVITGRASGPVYLWINQPAGTIELRDGSHLWGQDYFAAADALLVETDPKAKVAGIGPAGENLVRIAGIMSGPSAYVRAAARGGTGALMGSKNLKAIVVRGKQKPDYPDLTAFREVVKEQNPSIQENSLAMTHLGTAGGVVATERYGDIPLRNWQLGSWPAGAERVTGKTIYDRYLVKHTYCYACPIGCGKEVEVTEGPYPVPRGEGVEYETVGGFAGSCYIDDAAAVLLANSLCNRYGLDTISTSATVAFAMEAYENELIGPQETGGIELRFGNADAMLAMIDRIAHRKGIGDLLAEGSRAAARRLGGGAEHYAIHVKGLEVAFHDPRSFVSMAVNYATAARGGCHLEAASYWNGYGVVHPDLGYPATIDRFKSGRENAKLAYDYQNYAGVYNPLGLCKFLIKGKVGPERVCQVVNSALGWDWTTEELLTTGDRIFQLKRLINLWLGVTAADDTLPKRFLEEPRPDGSAAGVLPDLALMLPIYYELRDWNENGIPRPRRLEQLGLT
jgi:aldehyde:ferredoxin oxidoreductase